MTEATDAKVNQRGHTGELVSAIFDVAQALDELGEVVGKSGSEGLQNHVDQLVALCEKRRLLGDKRSSVHPMEGVQVVSTFDHTAVQIAEILTILLQRGKLKIESK